MAGTGFKMDAGWRRWAGAIDPRAFESAARPNVRRAAVLNGALAVRAVRKSIREGAYTPNAELTIALKGSSKPLVDSGHGIFQAVTSEVQDDWTVFVGILRADEHYDIAVALHDGCTIPVSDKMRGMFLVLWQASIGARSPSELTGRAAELWARQPKDWKPLKSSTTAIIIPARPFLAAAFSDSTLKAAVKKNWQQALQKTMRDLAKKGA